MMKTTAVAVVEEIRGQSVGIKGHKFEPFFFFFFFLWRGAPGPNKGILAGILAIRQNKIINFCSQINFYLYFVSTDNKH